MTNVFKSEWWSVSLPTGWHGRRESQGASFSKPPGSGTLQISAAQKEYANASDADLREFAISRGASENELVPISSVAFSGFLRVKSESTLEWKEWWLRCGPFVIYATYVTPTGQANKQKLAEADSIVESLAIR